MPSGLRYVAYTGHTLVHGGSSHWRHGRGRNRVRSSDSSTSTCIQLMIRPRTASFAPTAGTLFSALQAMTQAWQPVQRSRSITIPQSAMASGLEEPDAGGVEETEAPEGIGFVGDEVVGFGAFAAEEGNVNDLGEGAGIELGLEPDSSLGRFHPDPVPALHSHLPRRLGMDLHPPFPGCSDVNRRLLQEPGLVPPTPQGPAHQAIGVEAER